MKQEILSFIDRLASKELTRGLYVRCKPFDDEGTVIYKEKTLWYVEVIKSKHDVELPHVSALREQDIEPIGHPILLGTCLQKLEEMIKGRFGDKALGQSYASMGSIQYQWQYWMNVESQKLMNAWSNCGFTKSLQSIFDSAEWECQICDHIKSCPSPESLKPKQPHIRELFQFLLQLNLAE